MSDSPHSSPLDRAFQAWLRISPTEENLSLNDFLATQPESLRKNLRRMIADYGILQEAVGEQGTTFIEGRTIDDFRLVRELGRGGMGSVWEADQLSLNRRVALKLLKPQFNFSPQSLQRFQREAEAGGRLQHVGIVQTYGVGEADGIHWIAQELIPGGFTFADLLSSLREEPELPVGYYRHVVHVFLQMADALEYAHQQGVIHRDIKPGNILMRSDDLPKVADFGLAQVEDNLGLSRSGDYLGTPYYMSPEQAMSKRMGLDHRSDIFSLGATLYEALTLTRAFDGDSSHQVFRKILTVDPPDPRALRSRVPHDLAIICGKCLEKNPDRRYVSMADLADDLRRHLHDEPIFARPPSRMLRIRKWCHRHPVIAVAGSITAMALCLISFLAFHLTIERNLKEEALAVARGEATTSGRVVDFLVSLFGVNDPSQARGESVLARELLDKGAEKIATDLQDDPKIQARLMLIMGDAYRALGMFAEAEPLLQGAVEIRRDVLGRDHADTLEALNGLATLYYYQDRTKDAERIFREMVEANLRALGPDHPKTLDSLSNLGLLCYIGDNFEEAETFLGRALEGSRRVNGADHASTLGILNNYALVMQARGKLEAAEEALLEAFEVSERVIGPDHPDTLSAMNNYALLLQGRGKLEEAEELLRMELEIGRRVNGTDHPDTLKTLNNLGLLLIDRDKLDEADTFLQAALDGSRRKNGNDHRNTFISLDNLGSLRRIQGRFVESEAILLESLAGWRREIGPDHDGTLTSQAKLVRLYLDMGRLDEAELLARKLVQLTPKDSPKREVRETLLKEVLAAESTNSGG